MKKIDIKTRPCCPFCGQKIARPAPPVARRLGEFSGGRCSCGAVYTSDPTGFNVGAAMVETLFHACDDNWDLAWDLLPEDDYITDRVENYDEQTHQIVETRNLDGRAVKGVLFFVRLHRDIAELAAGLQGQEGGKTPAGNLSIPAIEPERDPKRQRQKADKEKIKTLAEARDIAALVDLAFDDAKTLHYLQRLLYAPDEAARWRTAHVIGQVCARLSTRQPGRVSDLLHRLFEASSDSAAASWGLVETIGAIIAARPDLFGSFTRHLLRYLGYPTTRNQVLWALGTIALLRPDLIRAQPFYQLFALLDSPDSATRALVIRLAGRIRATEVAPSIAKQAESPTPVIICEDGRPVQTTIAALCREALALINQRKENLS